MWPLGIREGASPGRPALVLTGDLVRAVKTEAAIAVARHWGTTWRTVRVWRRALSVKRMTPGSTALAAELGREDIGALASAANRASLAPTSRQKRDETHARTMKWRTPAQSTIDAAREANHLRKWNRWLATIGNVTSARNIAIMKARHEGRELADIGREFGLSKQRIHQLVKRLQSEPIRGTGKRGPGRRQGKA